MTDNQLLEWFIDYDVADELKQEIKSNNYLDERLNKTCLNKIKELSLAPISYSYICGSELRSNFNGFEITYDEDGYVEIWCDWDLDPSDFVNNLTYDTKERFSNKIEYEKESILEFIKWYREILNKNDLL